MEAFSFTKNAALSGKIMLIFVNSDVIYYRTQKMEKPKKTFPKYEYIFIHKNMNECNLKK